MKNTIFILLSVLGTVFQVHAQSVQEDLLAIQHAYELLAENDYAITYNLYKGHEGSLLTESYEGSYQKVDEDFQVRIKNQITVKEGKVVMILDQDNEVIAISKAGNSVRKQETMFAWDQMRSVCESVIPLKGKGTGYSFELKAERGGQFSKVDVYLNSKTNQIEKLVYFYAASHNFTPNAEQSALAKPRLEVVYRKKKRKDKALSISDYLVKHKGTWHLQKAYADYEFINQL